MKSRKLSEVVVAGLSPGVRDLVVWLNEQGFWTSDSGDGSNHAAGMEGAFPYPSVVMFVRLEDLIPEARRLYECLKSRGVQFEGFEQEPTDENPHPEIQAIFNPADEIHNLILLQHVDSKTAGF